MDLLSALREFHLKDPRPLTKTGIAELWRVRSAEGHEQVLKLYHGSDMGNETAGVGLMQAWAQASDRHVPRIYHVRQNALVIEFLAGKTLGQALREGQWDQNTNLAVFGRDLYRLPLPPMPHLPTLDAWFQHLFDLKFHADCPQGIVQDFRKATGLARHLLATQTDIRPLHGDLHHDNVFYSDRGLIAIDAKGVLGEPAYEMANAMRNPKGCDPLLRDRALQRQRLEWFAQGLEVDQKRLAQWAAAKCAWSIGLRAKGTLKAGPGINQEADLLSLLLQLADEV
ncbi:MAG: aminoglycoside phosphotransferase family protein [Pelagimonas sp.]|uniref:aminoglycoside phosphotransferase family protein n=1 Tax=Pelagimonas sp. TaxID=2073170 RepID=UPI003D6BFA48